LPNTPPLPNVDFGGRIGLKEFGNLDLVKGGKVSSATDLARQTIRKLIESGISDFVVSPGSRNAPLSIALHEAKTRGIIDLHIKLDERGAAFYALGISKATNKQVAVICTSGTAAANFHPALLEAWHASNKLIAITADRPDRLRKTGANQTTDQVGMFPNIPVFDLVAGANFELGVGPTHLNIQFDEPLLPKDTNDWLSGLHLNPPKQVVESTKSLSVSGNGVIVIGHDRGTLTASEIAKFVETSGLPVIAEDPLTFPNCASHASAFLSDEVIRNYLKPDFAIVIGRTTLSRSINSFLALADKTFVIDPRISTIDTKRTASQVFFALPKLEISTINQSWISDWKEISKLAAKEISDDQSWSEKTALRTISAGVPNGAALFVGSSRPIRDIEAFATPRSGIEVFANRGLAGIDGNLSTIFGISNSFERTYAVIGDLTFLHDLTALLAPTASNLTIFIIDNNGGGIFSTLPQSGVAGFEEIFATPQNQDLEKIISSFQISVTKVKTSSDLNLTFSQNNPGLNFVIVEVPNRDLMAANLAKTYSRISSAVRIGLNLA
jgi:2-succinyl-5-enolpyruvyl-6-hydroxy-3-cyclohexene-1-carboxylate synthase